jgi:mannose-6-phosphate isomerase-like protein (cupin superfamily)
MSNSSIFLILAVLVAAIFGAIYLGIFSNNQVESPQLLSLETNAINLSGELDVAAVGLFESSTGTAALMKINAEVPLHVHTESTEIIYVRSGQGAIISNDESNELLLNQGNLIILLSGTPMTIQNRGDQSLELFVFLSPPSHEENVLRIESEAQKLSVSGGFDPIDIDLPSKFAEYDSNSQLEPIDSALAGFVGGRVSLVKLFRSVKTTTEKDKLLLLMDCDAVFSTRNLEFEITADHLLIVPAGNRYTLAPTSDQSCDLISFELDPETSAEN